MASKVTTYIGAVALVVFGIVGIGVVPREARTGFIVVAVINIVVAGVAVWLERR